MKAEFRRSERLKSKIFLASLTDNVPNNYLEANNSVD